MTLTTRFTGLLTVLLLVGMASRAGAEPAMDDATADALRAAIEKNWNMPTGLEHADRYTISLRLHMSPEGVVTQIEILDDKYYDREFRTLAESARRAVLITQHEDGRLPIPRDKYSPTIVVRWPMKLICEQAGGC